LRKKTFFRSTLINYKGIEKILSFKENFLEKEIDVIHCGCCAFRKEKLEHETEYKNLIKILKSVENQKLFHECKKVKILQ
jgi:hypothetical protein